MQSGRKSYFGDSYHCRRDWITWLIEFWATSSSMAMSQTPSLCVEWGLATRD